MAWGLSCTTTKSGASRGHCLGFLCGNVCEHALQLILWTGQHTVWLIQSGGLVRSMWWSGQCGQVRQVHCTCVELIFKHYGLAHKLQSRFVASDIQ